MNDLLSYLSWFIIGISIIISGILIYKRKKISGFLFFFAIWAVFETSLEILSTFLGMIGVNNLFLFHINAVVEFTLLTLYFDRLFKEIKGPEIKLILWPGLFLIMLNSLFIQDLTVFNSYSFTCISLGMVLMTIFYFIKLFEAKMELEKKMLRLILTGSILVIHSTQLFPVLFGNALITLGSENEAIIWIVRACIILLVKIIIFYTLIGHFMHLKDQKKVI